MRKIRIKKKKESDRVNKERLRKREQKVKKKKKNRWGRERERERKERRESERCKREKEKRKIERGQVGKEMRKLFFFLLFYINAVLKISLLFIKKVTDQLNFWYFMTTEILNSQTVLSEVRDHALCCLPMLQNILYEGQMKDSAKNACLPCKEDGELW